MLKFWLLLLLSSPAFSQIAPVNNTTAGGTGASAPVTATLSTTGADLIVVAVTGLSGTVGTLTDAVGSCVSPCSTWYLATNTNTARGFPGQCQVQIWYTHPAATGASHAITWTGGGFPSLGVTVWSGSAAGAVFDQEAGRFGNAATTQISNTITPVTTGELWLSSTCPSSAETSMTPGNGTALPFPINLLGANHYGIASSSKIQTSIVTEGETWTYSASLAAGVEIASFKPAGACVLTTMPRALPAGVIGTPYSTTFTASAGCASPTFSVLSGVLPAGLTLSGAVLSGTPVTTSGTYSFVIKIADANGPSQFLYTLSVTGNAPVISAASCTGNSPSSALCTWTTDVPSSSKVQCGLTANGAPWTTYSTPTALGNLIGIAKGVTSHSMAITGLPNNTGATTYTCQVLSGQNGSSTATSSGVTTGTLATIVSTPVTISAVSTLVRYNDQFNGSNGLPNNGRSYDGDSHFCTWAADGNEDCVGVDGAGRNSACGSGHIMFHRWPTASDLTYTNITAVDCGTNFLPGGAPSPSTESPIAVRGYTYYPIFWTNLTRMNLMVSNDHGATTQAPLNNQAGAGYTGVAGGDVPGSYDSVIAHDWINNTFQVNAEPGVQWFFVQFCQDHSINCTWVANQDGYVYYLTPGPGETYYLLNRIPIDDLLAQTIVNVKSYIGTAINNTSDGLLDAAWSTSTASAFHFSVATLGRYPQMAFLPDFNRYVSTGWISTSDFSQTMATIVSDVGPYPWNVATPIAYLPRNNANLNYAPAFQQLHLASYIKRSSTPTATIKLMTTGFYKGQAVGAPASNQYSPQFLELGFAPRTAVPVRSPLSYAGSRTTHIAKGLDLYYDFQGCTNAGSIPDLSPNGVTLAQKYAGNTTSPANPPICDKYGMWNFGLWTGFSSACSPACASPVNYTLASPYNVALGDFTAAVVFAHYPTGNGTTGLAPVSGEIVLDATDFKLTRSSTTANSWNVKVGATTTASPFTLTTDVASGGTTWPLLFIRRSGSTVNMYSSAGITASAAPTVLATLTDGTALAGNALNIGSTFQGTMGKLLIWNRALDDGEMYRDAGVIRAEMLQRGLVIP